MMTTGAEDPSVAFPSHGGVVFGDDDVFNIPLTGFEDVEDGAESDENLVDFRLL